MWKVDALSLDCKVLRSRKFIMIGFGSLDRDYSLSKGDMILQKGLRSIQSQDVQLQFTQIATTSNDLRTI